MQRQQHQLDLGADFVAPELVERVTTPVPTKARAKSKPSHRRADGPEFPPTAEQEAIKNCRLEKGELVLIDALAGSGKTTSYQFLTAAHPTKRFLYLCYNKDLSEAAKDRFGPHVSCKTSHALAFGKLGYRYRHKLGNLRAADVRAELNLSSLEDATMVLESVNNFLFSARPTMELVHMVGPEDDRDWLLPLAQKLWAKMLDLSDPTLMPHDGYLKQWVLSRPDLSEFDVILLDEGQDANPLLLSLLLQQWKAGSCALVIVGDRHQSIYLWRGATNAMQYCDKIATQKFVLTECFRFPQFIANHANAILHEFKREKSRLIGRGRGRSDDGPPAFISRTNAGLLERAINAVAEGKCINFAATTAGADWNPYVPYKFGEILDVLAHSMGESYRVKTPYLRRYASFDEICEAVDGEHPDIELKAMVDVVNRYGAALPRIVDDITDACVAPHQADLCFSSGHRSKGKEWASTELNGDFLPVHDPAKLEEMKNKLGRAGFEQEVNLFYVALTRTKTIMSLPPTFTSWFNPRLGAQRAA